LLGHPLTFMDVITFIAAVPITIIYRVIDGHWPGETTTLVQAGDDPLLQRLSGLATGLAYFLAGAVTTVMDMGIILGRNSPLAGWQKILLKVVGGILLVSAVAAAIYHGIRRPAGFGSLDWATWGIGLVTLGLTALSAVIPPPPGQVVITLQATLTLLNSVLAVAMAVITVTAFVRAQEGDSAPPADQDVLLFAANLALTIPVIVNPVKYLDPETLVPLLALWADATFRYAAAALILADTVIHWNG
jgi:hypothetical protein